LLAMILISSYRMLSRQLAAAVPFATFGLALLSVLIVYNQTEAAFGASFLWCMLLLCAVVVPLSPARMPVRQAKELGRTAHLRVEQQTNVRAIRRPVRTPRSLTIS